MVFVARPLHDAKQASGYGEGERCVKAKHPTDLGAQRGNLALGGQRLEIGSGDGLGGDGTSDSFGLGAFDAGRFECASRAEGVEGS